MLEKHEFIQFILSGQPARPAAAKSKGKAAARETDALGGFGFDDETTPTVTPVAAETSFARQLLEASGFGPAQHLATSEVILGGDPAAQHLPDKVYYWPKAAGRPYQTILFELTQPSSALLNAPLFKPLKGVLEDALTRLVQDTLKGFEIGGERRRADVKQGRQEETLCVVSIRDERNRDGGPANLVCFGTVARGEGSLETFHIREEARFWEPQLAQDHLERLYDRHFRKLATERWQDAFISGEERKLARKLMDVCQGTRANESKIQEAVVNLLEEIALSYGLRKKPGAARRLEATDLPKDHDIGISEEVLAGRKANPFKGMTLRDEKNRLLGYIIYCLDQKKDAEVLRQHLQANNRFHNVLVVYPNGDSTGLELWQGRRALDGKLTKSGAKFDGEGKVVNLLSRFFVVSKALVANPVELAAELAYRARYLRAFALRELEKPKAARDKDLNALYESFHEIFLKNDEADESKQHDQFADSYAQTLTYGLLSARWISKDDLRKSGERFTLDNASDLLERTSPFFKELFTQVISKSHDASRDWLLQDITDLLDRIDIDAVFATVEDDVLLGHDPVMHFYEPFLAAYDPSEKKRRGVFYTPHPVVSYIVRSLHELLQTEFGLEDGLADTTTWGEMLKRHPGLTLPPLTDQEGEKRTIAPSEPFVQILDPATGTATFLVEVIDVIHRTLKKRWENQGLSEAKIAAAWNEYVPKHLLPRVFGYELMMAPYAIAHLKIGIKLAESGYKFGSNERARVYLTNALEPALDFSGSFSFAVPALAHEASAVNEIKRQRRFTVVVGNPPYSALSANLSPENRRIVDRYRSVNGIRIQERSMLQFEKNIQDDYIKFFAIGQTIVETSGVGVLGYVTNHSYLDGVTLRGMRNNLVKTFSTLRLIDLHGNTTKKENASAIDENVFDIQQGVAIALLSKQANATESSCHSAHLRGPRLEKYQNLAKTTFASTHSRSFQPHPDNYFFLAFESGLRDEYQFFLPLPSLLRKNLTGTTTGFDSLLVDFDKNNLIKKIQRFGSEKVSDSDLRNEFSATAGHSATVLANRLTICEGNWTRFVKPFQTFPFDYRSAFLKQELLQGHRFDVMENLGPNKPGLVAMRQTKEQFGVFVVTGFCGHKLLGSYDRSYVFPLYDLSFDDLTFLDSSLVNSALTDQTHGTRPTEGDIFHYIYAIFHSPTYRTRYAEFLKIDFPRLPLTSSLDLFRSLAKLGGELTALHLLESPKLKKPLSKFSGPSREVTKPDWTPDHSGTVWIDAKGSGAAIRPGTSGFEGVPEAVWNFHIGGYQVCHKWLKDRKDRALSDEDIAHYHKIVVALSETIRLMAEIDEVINEHGGWPGAFQSGNAPAGSAKG